MNDAIDTGLLLVTALGVAATFWQARTAAVTQRATFLKDLYLRMHTDIAAGEIYYLIEHNRFEFDRSMPGSDLERKVDRLLALVDLILAMRDQGAITAKEFSYFEYQVNRVSDDKGITAYVAYMINEFEKFGAAKHAFPALELHMARRKGTQPE